jgi:RimJ/RimL family protein N-acetyltransferase
VTILFYRRDPGDPVGRAALPPGIEMRVWQPAVDGVPPAGPHWRDNIAWWALDHLGLFARRDFAEVTLWWEGRLLHRLIVTPRWFRFPFMAPGDLQFGDLWTHPEARDEGLARAAVTEMHRRLHGTRLWYVADARNERSARLAEACGYRLVGSGRRTRPLGIGLVGRFRIDPSDPSAGRSMRRRRHRLVPTKHRSPER